MPQAVFDDPDGTLAMLRDSVMAMGKRRLANSSRGGFSKDAAESGHGADWHAMAEAGWTGLLLPENMGGAGLGIVEQAVLSEALGRVLICEPIAASAAFASVLLREAPVSAERDRLARGLSSGTLLVSPAWCEPPKGCQPLNASVEADTVVLTGEVRFVEQAASATDFLTIARSDAGMLLLSVPAKAPGIAFGHRPGVDGAPISSLHFKACRLPVSQILAKAKDSGGLVDSAVAHARIALAAELAGIASRAVEMTIGYTKDRVQFGKPIASFQAVQHRLVDMWSDAEFACAAVSNAVEKQASEDAKSAHMAVLAAKARCGDAAVSICRRAVHLHGAMGFTDEHDIGRYLKRAIALGATLGQPEALRLEFLNLEHAA